MTTVAWGLAGLAMLAAAGLFGVERRVRAERDALAVERDTWVARCDELEGRLSREEKTRRRQAEALAEHRKKEDKARRRASKGPGTPLGTAVRLQDLESALARAERERDSARRERDALEEERAKLQARLDAAVAARVTPDRVEAAGPDVEGLESQLAQAREQVHERNEALRDARGLEARLRKRIANQEQLYAALRGELEIKKDRLRAQEETLERLRALHAARVD